MHLYHLIRPIGELFDSVPGVLEKAFISVPGILDGLPWLARLFEILQGLLKRISKFLLGLVIGVSGVLDERPVVFLFGLCGYLFFLVLL